MRPSLRSASAQRDQRNDDPQDPKRSALMARVRGCNTKPELVVRRVAHELGFRFRLHQGDLPGTPDLVFPRLKMVVLVHGCFWHRHHGCYRATTPKTRRQFWLSKFRTNLTRDRRTIAALRRLGWKVLVVWECETFEIEALRKRLSKFLCSASSARNRVRSARRPPTVN
jgi:DNA mismatch endonuclease (patch repair protein)